MNVVVSTPHIGQRMTRSAARLGVAAAVIWAGDFGGGIACADTGPTLSWSFSPVASGGGNLRAGRLYVSFDNPDAEVLEVFDVTIDTLGSCKFRHNDFSTVGQEMALGSWSPSNFFPRSGFGGNPLLDSYVTIGGITGTIVDPINDPTNTTVVGSPFAANETLLTGTWSNGVPGNSQGQGSVVEAQPTSGAPQGNHHALIAHFVVTESGLEEGKILFPRLHVTLKCVVKLGPGLPASETIELSATCPFYPTHYWAIATCNDILHGCLSEGEPGCDDPDCCTCVCNLDPLCCAEGGTWDILCVALASNLCPVDPSDVDQDGITDCLDICSGQNDFLDCDGDWVPDGCDDFVGVSDINCDGSIDGADLGVVLGAWGQPGGPADLNGDGVVDGGDLGALLAAWTG